MDKSVDEFLPEILELELETYLLFGFCILEFKRYIKTKVEVPSGFEPLCKVLQTSA